MAAIKDDDQRRAFGDAVKEARVCRHQGDVQLAGENGRHCERTVVELLDLDIQAHFLEIAALIGDIESTAGDKGALADPDHVCSRRWLHNCGGQPADKPGSGYDS